MDETTRNPGNEKPISLHPLTPEEALGGLIQSKPEQKAQQTQSFKKGDRVAISLEAKSLPSDVRGKRGIVLESWERVREQTDEPRYFLYVVQVDDPDQKIEVDETDLTPA